eukprot:PhM_4_TR17000/c0_g1_i2/m.55298
MSFITHVTFPKMCEGKLPDDVTAQQAKTTVWCTCEKIHGAQLVVHFDGRSGQFALSKRREIISRDEGDDFFGLYSTAPGQRLVAHLRQKAELVWREASSTSPDVAIYGIRIYGELCGGGYPHKDCMASSDIPGPVQTGVYYCPDLCFVAFDLCCVTSVEDAEEGVVVQYAAACEVFNAVGLLCAKPIVVGSLSECLTDFHPLRRESTLSTASLGLPRLTTESYDDTKAKSCPFRGPLNLAEGVVVKPWRHPNADIWKRISHRPMAKLKIDEFREDVYHAAVDPSSAAINGWGILEQTQFVIDVYIPAMINGQRYSSVLSKTGPAVRTDKTRMKAVLAEFVADVMEAVRAAALGDEVTCVSWGKVEVEVDKQSRRFIAEQVLLLLQEGD